MEGRILLLDVGLDSSPATDFECKRFEIWRRSVKTARKGKKHHVIINGIGISPNLFQRETTDARELWLNWGIIERKDQKLHC